MDALDFVRGLIESGRVRVAASAGIPANIDDAVLELDRVARLHLPLDAPALAADVGAWGLLTLYRACQALVYRDIDVATVREMLSAPCPRKPSPETCYSADLALAFLPDLLKLARGVATDDPLIERMLALATAWPLSSVGAGPLESLHVDGFIGHPGLRRLYADRIIERADATRLANPAAKQAVLEALGAFGKLSPEMNAIVHGAPGLRGSRV